MATYYVRPDGSDTNSGTGSGTGSAWQTFSKVVTAGTPVVGGDTVYFAPGVYRNSATITSTLNPSSLVQFIGDVSASQFSGVTPGVVRLTYFTNDNNAPAATTLQLQSMGNVSFDNFYFEMNVSFTTGNAAKPNITFTKCHFGVSSAATLVTFNFDTTSALNYTFDKCIFEDSGISLTGFGTTASEVNLNASITNCFFRNTTCVTLSFSGTAGIGRKYGGINLTNCTFVTGSISLNIGNSADVSLTYPMTAKNCVWACVTTATSAPANVANSIQLYNCRLNGSTVAAATTLNSSFANGIHGLDDYARLIHGVSKRHPYMPRYTTVLSGEGTATGAPATDLFGYTRPSPPAIGVLEINDLTGSSGGLIVHPGMTGGMRG